MVNCTLQRNTKKCVAAFFLQQNYAFFLQQNYVFWTNFCNSFDLTQCLLGCMCRLPLLCESTRILLLSPMKFTSTWRLTMAQSSDSQRLKACGSKRSVYSRLERRSVAQAGELATRLGTLGLLVVNAVFFLPVLFRPREQTNKQIRVARLCCSTSNRPQDLIAPIRVVQVWMHDTLCIVRVMCWNSPLTTNHSPRPLFDV